MITLVMVAFVVVAVAGSNAATTTESASPGGARAVPESAVATPTDCVDLDVAVTEFAKFAAGDTELDVGIAALTRVRDAGTDVDDELTMLIDSYTSIAGGDLTALGAADQAATITQAAARVTDALSQRCPDVFDTTDQN